MNTFKRLTAAGWLLLPTSVFVSLPSAAASCDASYVSSGGASCTFTPDSMRVQVYQFGLCETAPSLSDDGDCQFFVNSDTAVEVDLTDGGAFNLANEGSLTTGTYSYVLMRWDNTLGFSHQFDAFTTALSGADGVAGTYCYSNGNTETTSPLAFATRGISCATSAATASASQSVTSYELVHFGGGLTSLPGTLLSGGTYTAYLLDADRSQSTATLTTDTTTLAGSTLSWHTSSAAYMWVLITLSTPIEISATTTSLDIGVNLKDGFALGAGWHNLDATAIADICRNGINYSGTNYTCLNSAEFNNLGLSFFTN